MKLKEKFTNSIVLPFEYEEKIKKSLVIADDYAIEFAGYYEEILASGDYNLIDKDKKELLEIFKKEKGL
jgi:predicted nuclease of restriction endonuclease-like (RecB) superfamily